MTWGITLRLSEKQNWRENKICCLPREYWLSVHNLKDNALCTTVRKPVWLVRFMSTSVRVKGLRDRMTFKYFLHFFSRLRSASRFSMFWVTFTALFFFDPSCYSEIKCVLYHYIKVSLTWESEVCWLRNKKKSSNFTKTSYTKLKSLLTWSYQSSLHNYRRIKYL